MASGADTHDLTCSLLAKFRISALKAHWSEIRKSRGKLTADGFQKHAMSEYSEWFAPTKDGHSEAQGQLKHLCKIMVSKHLSKNTLLSVPFEIQSVLYILSYFISEGTTMT